MSLGVEVAMEKQVGLTSTKHSSRGGKRCGAGRRSKCANGTSMKLHTMRWTAEQWADVKFLGMEAVRALVTREARRLRRVETTAADEQQPMAGESGRS